jgi:V8-like Glu-specific endopeptidase
LLLTHSNFSRSTNNAELFYDIDTTKEQSGSPVYILGDSDKLVGIHKSHHTDKNLSYGTMITDSLIYTLNVWAEEMKATFKIINKQTKIQTKSTANLNK